MAIDTKRKRASMIAFGNVTMPVTVVPDGTIGGRDKQVIAWGYYGIDVGFPDPDESIIKINKRTRTFFKFTGA